MSMTNTHTTACGTEPFDHESIALVIRYTMKTGHHSHVSITCARHFWMESTEIDIERLETGYRKLIRKYENKLSS